MLVYFLNVFLKLGVSEVFRMYGGEQAVLKDGTKRIGPRGKVVWRKSVLLPVTLFLEGMLQLREEAEAG